MTKIFRVKKRKRVLAPKGNLPKQAECREFIKIISDFVDLEFNENRSIRIRNHLITCVRCTQVYRDVRMMIQLCRSESMSEPKKVHAELWKVLQQKFKLG
ncbi:MAG: zf-HC2 domain-containing protein [candidate division WOR-3 bacterium]|nr:zf-HC2 domain-containing protein [candidate division WOR-3 bacterium]